MAQVVGIAAIAAATVLAGCSSGEKRKATPEERARAMLEVAGAALVEGDPTMALKYLVEAEKIDADLPELHHAKAIALHAKREIPLALESARKAVELNPRYTEALNTYGKILLDLGKLSEAEEPLKKAAADPLWSDSYKAYTNLGILYYRRGEYPRALEALDRAVAASPLASCHAHYYRGHVRLREGRFNDAIDEYDRATRKACAGFQDAHLALGIAYERGRQYEQARKKFLEIEKAFPNTQVARQAMDRLRYLP